MAGSATIPRSGTRTGGSSRSFAQVLLFKDELGGSLNMAVRAEIMWRIWVRIRVAVLAPILKVATVFCLVMSLMILVEKLFFGAVSLTVKLLRLKPERRYKWEPITPDEELGNTSYPMVLVQIPMYNEKEVYKKSIGSACELDWPLDRMIIQVLDDSTDPFIKDLVMSECEKWKSRGLNVHYEIRSNREGYKAGALKEGMKHPYVKECDYIAMFDADFQPEHDFLTIGVPFLVHNPELALVQARWKFVNADECMMTRIQEMSLDYHFKIEQESGSSLFGFFGFNGTAGIWRISAIDDAGGWKDRTTVEDMDLAVRAGLQGWRFVYVGDVKVKSELPSTFKAYRYQQHRWTCGPANLIKKMAVETLLNKKVSAPKKFYILYSFFFVGKIVAHTVTFIFYCVLVPASVLVPEVQIPLWGVAYVPMIITLCKAFGTPSSVHLLVFWVLFENVMSLHRFKASICGLLEVGGRVNEWVVTEKLGDALKTSSNAERIVYGGVEKITKISDEAKYEIKLPVDDRKKAGRKIWHRFHYTELSMGVFLIICGVRDVMYTYKGYFLYLFFQGIAFLVAGFDYVGTSTVG